MHDKDSENSEPKQIKEYINCFNFAYIQRLALATNGKVGVCEFVLCEMVRGLSAKSGKCIAKNDFFAARLCLTVVQISRVIKMLGELGMVENNRKKYGWERVVTEKYYQIVKHEKKHLSLREYEKAGLKITVPTELSQPEKKPRGAKTAKVASESSEKAADNGADYMQALYASSPKTRLTVSEFAVCFQLVNGELIRASLNISKELRDGAVKFMLGEFLIDSANKFPTTEYGLTKRDISPYFESWQGQFWREKIAYFAEHGAKPFGERCAELLVLPTFDAVQIAHRIADRLNIRHNEILIRAVSGFSGWASREKINLINNDDLGEVVRDYAAYVIAKNPKKNG